MRWTTVVRILSLLALAVISLAYFIAGALGYAPWLVMRADSRYPYPPISNPTSYFAPPVGFLTVLGTVLLVAVVFGFHYRKRNLFWLLLPFNLGFAVFGMVQLVSLLSRRRAAEQALSQTGQEPEALSPESPRAITVAADTQAPTSSTSL